ncbi:hypothetical protein [Lysobacter hankyongensis]
MAESTRYDGKNIEVLRGLEAVRRRPTMYVGDLSDRELPVRLLMQALCHAADSAVDGECTCVAIRVDGAHVDIDYDAGMPLDPAAPNGDQVALVFLSALAGCHNRKRHLSVGDELCEIGLAVLNAFCASLRVETIYRGWAAVYRFEKGKQIGDAPIVESSERDRTSISFHLDNEILGANILFDRAGLNRSIDRVRQLLPELLIDIS